MNATVVRLSCEQCRQRKTKCDKASPCSSCKNAGISCTTVQRARLPRGRTGKNRARNTALDTKVAHLEALVQQLEAQVQPSSSGSSPFEASSSTHSAQTDGTSKKTKYFVAKDFWAALSEEVSGLRNTLEESDDEDDTSRKPSDANQSDEIKLATSSETILFLNSPSSADSNHLQSPPKDMRNMLLYLYHQRVDCLIKATHWPTVVAMIDKQYEDPQHKVPSPSTEALEFAMYFLAISSITDEESTSLLLADREPLLRSFRTAAETLISRANLLQSPDLTVLQAFVIYLFGFRNSWQYVWTLLAIAVRVATALGLPARDEEISSSPIELEVRRRVWFVIAMLDSQTSFDRGFKPLLQAEDVQIPPLIINDSQLSSLANVHNFPHGFSEMSFAYVIQFAITCSRKLSAPSIEPDSTWSDWEEKSNAVHTCEESIKQYCASFGDAAHPFAQFIQLLGKDITVNMHLILRRPPWRRKNNAVPPWDDYDLLKATTEVLERASTAYDNPIFAPWAWYTKYWIKWYALSVLLAELCTPRTGELENRAYAIGQETFSRYSEILPDADSGMLWKPIVKLMRRVHQVRGASSSELVSSKQQQPFSGLFSSGWNAQLEQRGGFAASNSYQMTGVESQAADMASQQPAAGAMSYPHGGISNQFMTSEDIWQSNPNEGLGQIDDLSWLSWDNFLVDFGATNQLQTFQIL